MTVMNIGLFNARDSVRKLDSIETFPPLPESSSKSARIEPAQFPETHRSASPIAIMGIAFDNITVAETIDQIEAMIHSKRPHYVVTPNVDFLVKARHDHDLRRILLLAHLVLCDGTPLVWASRWLGNPLPERVAGSDLVPLLLRRAADQRFRVYFLGGSPETASLAVKRLKEQLPSLRIVGCDSPPYQEIHHMDHAGIRARIRAARPDLLFVCFGCPKQEKWMAMNYEQIGVPVCMGVGGTIDFLAGRLARAPRWMQKTGLEWTFRLAQEPRRLLGRYLKDIAYFSWGLLTQSWQFPVAHRSANGFPLDKESVDQNLSTWKSILSRNRTLSFDGSKIEFIDSTGIAALIHLQKTTRVQGGEFVICRPSTPLQRALRQMRLEQLFQSVPSETRPQS